jgi:hypothetical protein
MDKHDCRHFHDTLSSLLKYLDDQNLYAEIHVDCDTHWFASASFMLISLFFLVLFGLNGSLNTMLSIDLHALQFLRPPTNQIKSSKPTQATSCGALRRHMNNPICFSHSHSCTFMHAGYMAGTGVGCGMSVQCCLMWDTCLHHT